MRITKDMATFIDREMATKLLDMNTNNRKVKKNNLDLLIYELENGMFKFNGESIIVSKSGVLLDGQHRLLAVEKTGVPIESIIVWDVEDNTFGTIDTGSSRSAYDVLNVNKIENYALKAKLAKMFILSNKGKGIDRRAKEYKITNDEILAFTKRNNDELDEVCKIATRYYQKKKLLATSEIGFFWHIFSSENRKMAELFFEAIFSGLFSSSKDPCYILRSKLEDDKMNKNLTLNTVTKHKMIAKDWNKFIANEELTFLRITENEIIRFPEVKLK